MALLQSLARGDVRQGEDEERNRESDKQQIQHVTPLSPLRRRVECEDQAQDQ
jgi:hypothetical protein